MLPNKLGDKEFINDYKIKYAYLAGAMYRGIASKEMLIKLANANLIGFLGTGGMSLEWISNEIDSIKTAIGNKSFGTNLLHNLKDPQFEFETVKLYLSKGVHYISASAYTRITPALVYYRVSGIYQDGDTIKSHNFLMAKISHHEIAKLFLSPPPLDILKELLHKKLINEKQFELAKNITLASDIVVEADSGGHTDMGNLAVLLPTIQRSRDQLSNSTSPRVRVGAAGGIGTPEAAASAFLMGADFILTGSINQCTVESGASQVVKELLSTAGINDMAYCPAGDMFEMGAKVQVLKKGNLFSVRAQKLYELYKNYESLEHIPPETISFLEKSIFKMPLTKVWQETHNYLSQNSPKVIEFAQSDPKVKMACIFKWYFAQSVNLALSGDVLRKTDFQIHCGPALGAFNEWVKGTTLEKCQNRHVDSIADELMTATALFIDLKLKKY